MSIETTLSNQLQAAKNELMEERQRIRRMADLLDEANHELLKAQAQLRHLRTEPAREAELTAKIDELTAALESGFMPGTYARLKELQTKEARLAEYERGGTPVWSATAELASLQESVKILEEEVRQLKDWRDVVRLYGYRGDATPATPATRGHG